MSMPAEASNEKRKLSIMELLRPHRRQLWFGLLAITGESIADLLGPWPLKIVLDDVRAHGKSHQHGWLVRFIHATVGTDAIHILLFACVATMAIAILDALCSY